MSDNEDAPALAPAADLNLAPNPNPNPNPIIQMNAVDEENAEGGDVNAAAVKLPPFWRSTAEFWFIQAESQFRMKSVTNKITQFDHVVSRLNQEDAKTVIDILKTPPTNDSYKALKDRLLRKCTLSDSERCARILAMPGLGDRKPSDLMDDMRALLPETETEGKLFREIFLQQLPSDIRVHLVHIADCKELATEADKRFESLHRGEVHAVKAKQLAGPRSQHRRLATVDGRDDINEKGLCFYHASFGKRAQKCRPGCKEAKASGNAATGRQ